MFRYAIQAALILAIAGCSQSGESPVETQEGAENSSADLLTDADLRRFLSIVRSHEGAMIPEFTPLDEEDSFDFNLPADKLRQAFRSQFERLFDVERQGAIWQRDGDWSRSLAGRKISPQRFAALVRDVSLAIMRVRLEARVNLDQLVAQARLEVGRAERVMNQIDEVPPQKRTREAASLRTRLAIQLGRSVALLEFAEMIREVPAESAAVVRRYSRELKPLLPPSINEDLLAELKDLASRPSSEVVPAVYESPEPE